VTILPDPAPSTAPSPMPDRARSAALLLAAFLLGCVSNPASVAVPPAPPVAKTEAPVLRPGVAVQRDLPAGGRDEIPFALEADRYVRVSFETRGADLAVSLLGPKREVIARTAGTNGRLSMVTAAGGTYWIAVTAQEPQARDLSYRMTLQEWRPIQPGDEDRVSAETALSEAKFLEVAQQRYAQAIEQAQKALSVWNEMRDSVGRFDALYEIGAAYDLLQNKDEAVRWYKEALQVASDAGDRRGVAKTQTAIGLVLFNLPGRQQEACHYLELALPVWQELRDSVNVATVLLRLGLQDYSLGKFDEAMSRFEQAAPLADESGDRDLLAEIRNSMGNVYGDRGESREALAAYETARQLATEVNNDGARAVSLTGIGKLLRRRGEPGKALDNLLEAREINHRLANAGDEGRVLLHLGGVYLDLGQTDKAREEYQEAIGAFQVAKDGRWIANAFLSLGNAERAADRTQEALAHYQKAWEIAETAKLGRQRGDALQGIGVAQLKLQHLPEALQALQEALPYQQATNRLGEASTHENLGKVYMARGDLEKAAVSLHQALEIASQVGASLDESSIRFELARLERQRGDPREALLQIQRAIQVLETVRSDISNDRLRTSFFASRRDYYNFYIDLLLELDGREPGRGHADAALAVSERGRARSLLDLLTEGRMELTRGISSELRQREAEIAARLSQIQGRLIEERSDRRRAPVLAALETRLREAEKEWEAVEQQIKTEYPRYYQIRNPSLLERGGIQTLLDPDSALLEYSLGEEVSYLFVVTRNGGLKVHRLDLSRSQIAEEAGKIRRALDSPGELSYAYRSAAYRLYQSLVAPAKADLAGKKRLLIAADGVLNRLPFDVLLTERAQDSSRLPGLYLINGFTTSYIPSASVLSTLSRQRPVVAAGSEPSPRFLAFAPDYGKPAGLQEARNAVRGNAVPDAAPAALEGAEAEVKAIAERYPGKAKLYLGPDASLENVKKGLVSEWVHFAGHGLIDEERPESSGLVLQGGTLTVADIFNLDLNAGLVVLSACETAGKEVSGEGLVGLTRAFFYAGTPSVMVTLWRVADRKTPDLMLRFYSNLDQSGDMAEALRQAKLGMIGKRGLLAHPYYWAPFILVGKPR
jgi:CHAT domain-containing protein/Flp pilus assembly protein TadD